MPQNYDVFKTTMSLELMMTQILHHFPGYTVRLYILRSMILLIKSFPYLESAIIMKCCCLADSSKNSRQIVYCYLLSQKVVD